MKFIFIVLLTGIVGLVALYYYLRLVVLQSLPFNAPSKQSVLDSKIRVVLAGDSNTHGNMSYCWAEKLNLDDSFQLFNAGVNADLSHTLLRRSEEILNCRPQLVSILIGTNDVNATMSEANKKRYLSAGKIDDRDILSEKWYQQNLEKLVVRLKEAGAKVALLSLPLIGENLNHEVNQKADKYSEIAKQVALKFNVDFLDIRGELKSVLVKSKTKPSYESYFSFMQMSVMRRYVLRQSWDQISKAHGMELSPDFLHLNERSGEVIAKQVRAWVLKQSEQ